MKNANQNLFSAFEYQEERKKEAPDQICCRFFFAKPKYCRKNLKSPQRKRKTFRRTKIFCFEI
jgi:hypothetical protein